MIILQYIFTKKKFFKEDYDKLLLDYVKYNGGVVYQGSMTIMSYGTVTSALATAYRNTGREVYEEIRNFGIIEILRIILDNVAA